MFDPVLVPKLVSIALVLASFGLILLTLEQYTPAATARSAAGLVLLLLALNTPFVIWTTSGLENPLYVFLLLLLVRRILLTTGRNEISLRPAAIVGVIAATVALTRPDGLIFLAVYPAVLLLPILFDGRRLDSLKSAVSGSATYLVAFSATFGSYLLFRILYFGDLYPNTYHAKDGTGPSDFVALLLLRPGSWSRLDELMTSVASGSLQIAALMTLLVLTGVVLRHRRRAEMTVAAFLWASALLVLVLPADWMAENRFATPFVLFFTLLLGLVGSRLAQAGSGQRRLLGVAAAIFVAISLVQFAPRSTAFADNPTVPLDLVEEQFAERFDAYAETLEVADGSILLPDVGGMLLYSDLRVYDLAGLLDATIAKTVVEDIEAFYDYVFEEARPVFIHNHEWWAYRADLDADPRFRANYVAICEVVDPWARERFGEVRFVGDYVRKDAIASPDQLLQLQQGC